MKLCETDTIIIMTTVLTASRMRNLEKLTLVILSKKRDKELNQVINYWTKTPVSLVVIHDTDRALNYNNKTKLVYVKSKNSIIERLAESLDFILTPFVMIANDDEIFLIESILNFINYLENNKEVEAVGGQVIAYNWAGNKLLGNEIYPFLHNFSNSDNSPLNRIKKTFKSKNVMDVTLMYRSHEFKNIVTCCKNFTEYSTPVMYETMFAFFSSLYCRSIRLNDIYWMRNWFTPYHEFENWDRKLTWKTWCTDPSFQVEVVIWRRRITQELHLRTDFSHFETQELIKLLLNWEAIGERDQNLNKKNLWIRFKRFVKQILPSYIVWKFKHTMPIMRRKVMSDFETLTKKLVENKQLSLLDLENFKNFASEQKLLLKK